MTEWTPVDEALPHTQGRVIVTFLHRCGWRYVGIGGYIHGRWHVDGFPSNVDRVLAWCNLPEPWEGEP